MSTISAPTGPNPRISNTNVGNINASSNTQVNGNVKNNNASKLGTFSGVFIPTTLYTFSILMFLRFGFIIGQTGILGFIGMLCVSYLLDIITATSISAIATNGTVKGGGAYYLISRTLGPEFGGSIGVVFYLGSVFNTGMNSVGLINCLTYNFGLRNGLWRNWLPDTFWWCYLWSSIILIICTLICLAGSSAFSKTSNALFVILVISILSISVSALFVEPFQNPKQSIEYTGISLATLKQNLYPNFTKGADGSVINTKESWNTLFGVLFPATAGIFAGSSMSGDLKSPGKSIPRGTFLSLAFTFIVYNLVLFSLGSTVTRNTFYSNVNVVQYISLSGEIILIGEFATTFFGALMGIIGSAKLLQSLSRDNLIPGLTLFGKGSGTNDEPTFAIFITYVIAQFTMLFELNKIASLVTMALLLTFLVTNLACFILRISGSVNFRPAFQLFSWQLALIGAISSSTVMIYVDSLAAFGCITILIVVFLIIHYYSSPKPWGDVSQSLIFHQVRKYLLRLKQEHVKFWRPSFLLLLNDPRRNFKLIQFANSIKKGGLFILGHVIVTEDFRGSTEEIKHQNNSWNKYVDFSKIKAFVTITVAPKIEWGIRNLVLSSGLGSMRPNIVMLGAYNLDDYRKSKPLIDIPNPQPLKNVSSKPDTRRGESYFSLTNRRPHGTLPIDRNREESSITPQSYVTMLEDLIRGVKVNVAIAKGFENLVVPTVSPSITTKIKNIFRKTEAQDQIKTRYIDLWPVQMSAFAFIDTEGHEQEKVLTTNFDTYTMILQLGSILATTEGYNYDTKLRVSVFVEYENEVEQERQRVQQLLQNIRIIAEVRVFWLASGDLKTYEVIVNGVSGEEFRQTHNDTNITLRDESWWQEITSFRRDELTSLDEILEVDESRNSLPSKPRRPDDLVIKKLHRKLQKAKRRITTGRFDDLSRMRVQLSHLDPEIIAAYDDRSSDEDDESHVTSAINSSPNSINASSPNSPVRSASPNQFRHSPDLLTARPIQIHSRSTSITSPITIIQQNPLSPPRKDSYLENIPKSAPRFPINYSRTSSPHRSGTASPIRRPPPMQHQSLPKFVSNPVPPMKISTEEGEARSIMFDDSEETENDHAVGDASSDHDTGSHRFDNNALGLPPASGFPAAGLTRSSSSPSLGNAPIASGYPAQRAMPLSFNDLPSRAQHLILNELMFQYTDKQTVVMFTTLPEPAKETGESEQESMKYLSDLEVLCRSLPPCVLVRSNMVTVTVAL